MNPAQQPIPVKTSAMVTIDFDYFLQLKENEKKYDNMTEHLLNHEKALVQKDLKIKELEGNTRTKELEEKLQEFHSAVIEKDREIERLSALVTELSKGGKKTKEVANTAPSVILPKKTSSKKK